MAGLLLYCRAGFEKECAAEIQDQAAALGCYGYCRSQPDSGWLLFEAYQGAAGLDRLRFADLVFARQLIRDPIELPVCDPNDRLTPLLATLHGQHWQFGELRLEYPDSNPGKALSPLARSLRRLLAQRLTAADGYQPAATGMAVLHVFLSASTTIVVGMSTPGNNSPWPNGIPRLKLARAAPSRSTLKLEEALLLLLTPAERERRLRPGMTVVDLGAAPGGWSWQMVRRGLTVTAVDNGALAGTLLASGRVRHVQADGFRYQPPRPVDWLLCDMVEQPRRIAALMVDWLAAGWCRQAVFNLKLPMKKRYQEVRHCRQLIEQSLDAGRYQLRLRQLYHDRQEVTAYLYRR